MGLTQIVVTFGQTVALGSTKLEIDAGGLLGTVADTFGVGEMVLPAGKVLIVEWNGPLHLLFIIPFSNSNIQ